MKYKNNNIIITKADKGDSVVLLEKNKYIKKANKFIQGGNYKEVKYDYTKNIQGKVKQIIEDSNIFGNKIKLHKESNPVRLIILFIGVPAYKISKVCSNILKNCYEFKEKYRIKNSKEVVRILRTEVQIGRIQINILRRSRYVY